MMAAQMRNFFDQTGNCGCRIAGQQGRSVFTSTATQHGGQETTITSFHTTLHHGMIIVGVPREPRLMEWAKSPAAPRATTIAADGLRTQCRELAIAVIRAHVAEIALALKKGSEEILYFLCISSLPGGGRGG
jgi:NAD(P)H dehydrogenase (quinone)